MKTALIQQAYHGNKEQTLQVTVEKIAEAAQNGAQLIVLQELHQTEYFCQSEDTKFFEYANHFDSDIEFLSRIAKENSVVLFTSLF